MLSLITTIMQPFGTSLVLSTALLAFLFQNVGGAISSRMTSKATPEQLANRKRSFSIGYVS